MKEAEEELKISKKNKDCKIKLEESAREKNGRKHDLKKHAENATHKKYFMKVSAYHGGDLEGNSIQRFMENGTSMFNEVETYSMEQKN